jgi:hypothetical protein
MPNLGTVFSIRLFGESRIARVCVVAASELESINSEIFLEFAKPEKKKVRIAYGTFLFEHKRFFHQD